MYLAKRTLTRRGTWRLLHAGAISIGRLPIDAGAADGARRAGNAHAKCLRVDTGAVALLLFG